MATQVKFYSTTAASYSAIASKDAGGVYFVDGGALYKGTSRFGANKVYPVSSQTDLEAISGQISGDLAVGFGWTKAWNGTAWVQIENDVQITALISNTIPGLLPSLVPSFIPPVVSSMVSGLSVGNTNSYITYIEQDANGKVKAYAKTFPTLNLGATTKSSTHNGVTVSVTTQSGAVTGVQVAAPTYSAAQVTKSSTANGITASVTTSKGQVTTVSLYATDLTPTTVSAQTGTFTNLTVTNNANFSVTNVSATTLTIGGSTVEQLADKQIAAIAATTKTSTSNGITVSVTTSGGSVNKVELNASAFANVMHFRGVYPSPYSWTNPQGGDIIIIGGASSGSKYVNGQEWIYNDKASPSADWELIGDQATYATKAYVDTAVSSAVSAASDAYGLASYANTSAQAAYASAITNAVKASTGITSGAGNLVTAGAVAGYAMKKGDVTGGNHSSSMNGVGVKVVTAATTAVPTVSLYNIGTAASKNFTNAITAAGTSLPTESAVYSAISAATLVWLNANGSAIS